MEITQLVVLSVRYLPYENRTTDKKLEVCGRHYDDKGLQTSY